MDIRRRLMHRLIALVLALLMPMMLSAETIKVPFGTVVYCVLDQEVTSKTKHFSEGDMVRAHVWKDVVVEHSVVIREGTPVYAQISKIKSAKVAGIKGFVGIDALNVQAIDGTDVALDGGYDRSGRSNMALSITLAAVVFVPFIFIKGKQAKLPQGTIFDAIVRQATDVEFEGPRRIKLDLGTEPLRVKILYDDMDLSQKKIDFLPILVTRCGGTIEAASITAVNEKAIPPIPLTIIGRSVDESDSDCSLVRANVGFKELGKHFAQGLNRFTVQVGDLSSEVILDLEL